MKLFSFKNILPALALGSLLMTTACENGDQEFDDFTYQTVYFANQSPIRTITLGTDVYPTDLDNAHKCQLQVVLGGVWKNRRARKVQLAVDNSLCQGLKFEDGTPVTPMPDSYYKLAGTGLTIEPSEVRGKVDVQLTDNFFNDPKSVGVHYVIPVKIVSADDSILSGKDYTLYAVNYKNKWTGNWLAHGTDQLTTDKGTVTVTREAKHMEENTVVALSTTAYRQVAYPLTAVVDVVGADGKPTKTTCNFRLLLNFDEADQCTITTDTPNCTASGSGQWTFEGAKKAWGDKDRDLLDLNYNVTLTYQENGATKTLKISTKEQLIMRDRGNRFLQFTPTKNS